MQIRVQGKQLEVGAALTGHVTRQLSSAVLKYFDRPVGATVTFARDARAFRCEAHVSLPTGLTAAAGAASHDPYAAFELTAERIGKQLRRYKRRLRAHHPNQRKAIEGAGGPAYVHGAADSRDDVAESDSLQPVMSPR